MLPNRYTGNFALLLSEDSGDPNVNYVGKAQTGSTTTAAVWQVKKIDSTSGVIITWAGGDDKFDNIWDNREALSYS